MHTSTLRTFAFVIGFSTFLVGCVDYPRLRHSKHLDEVLIPQCFHKYALFTLFVSCAYVAKWTANLILDDPLLFLPIWRYRLSSATVIVLLLFATFWIGQLTRFIYDVPELSDMCNFYTYLLQIPDVCDRIWMTTLRIDRSKFYGRRKYLRLTLAHF